MKPDRTRNLGPHVNPGLPPGVESRAFRVQAPTEVLDAFQRLTPEARGRILGDALRAKVAQP